MLYNKYMLLLQLLTRTIATPSSTPNSTTFNAFNIVMCQGGNDIINTVES